MILTENELFAQFVLLSGSKIYFFWQKYTSQTKYFFGSLINWSPCINHGYLVPGAAAGLPPVPVLAAAEFPGGRLPPGLGHGGQHAAHGGGAGPGAQAGHAVQDAPGHRALAKQVRGVLP